MNDLERITKSINTAKVIIGALSTKRLLDVWELTTDINDECIPMVRGWLMDEFEKRNPQGFNDWLEDPFCQDDDLKYFMKEA